MARSKKQKSVAEPMTFTSGNSVPDSENVMGEKDQKRTTASWTPNKEEEADLKLVMPRVENEMYPAQQVYHQEWQDAKEIYEAQIIPEPNRPNIRIPWSFIVNDSAMAEEIDAFPDIQLDTQEDDDKPKLRVLEAAMKYALANANWDKVKIDARRISRIYGICPMRVSYQRETRLIKERVPVMGDDGFKVEYKETYDFPVDDITFEVIDDPKRFLIDDTARDIDVAEDCALFTKVNWNMFRQKVQHDSRFKNIDYVKPGVEYFMDASASTDSGLTVTTADPKSNSPKTVKILEYWNKALDKYVMIANGIIIRSTCLVDDHKELPFTVLHMYRRPHVFWSKGIPKTIESLEAPYNAVIAAEVQATKLAFPILTTTEDAGIDPRAIAPYPGIVLEGAMEKMKLEQLGTVPAEAYKLKEKLEQLMIWTTGINYQQIFSDNQSDRVGIESLKKESMLSRVNSNLRENESNFIVRLGNLLSQDIMQYYTGPKIRKLMSTDDLSFLKDLSFDRDGKQLVKDGSGNVKGVIERRKIPIQGVYMQENKTETGYQLSAKKDRVTDSSSYILARPEYIRTKSKLDIRAVRPSAMGSSKEARKLVFMELSNHALDVNATVQKMAGVDAQGQPVPTKPIWNLEYMETKLAEVNDLPPEKAIHSEDSDSGNEAQDAFKKIANPLMETFKKPLDFKAQAPQQAQVAGVQGAMATQGDPAAMAMSPQQLQGQADFNAQG